MTDRDLDKERKGGNRVSFRDTQSLTNKSIDIGD